MTTARIEALIEGLRDPSRKSRSPDPRQRPTWYVPGLPSRPFPDRRFVPALAMLESSASGIRRELARLTKRGHLEPHTASRLLVEQGAWRTLRFFNRGQRYRPVTAQCPRTTRLVEAIPGARSAGLVYGSVLRPHTHLAPHCGPTNTRWRIHLALDVPTGDCVLEVGGERRRWVPGRCLLFDDSFEHAAHNATERPRVVLIVDVWHPDLTAEEREALKAIFDRAAEMRRVARARPAGALAGFYRTLGSG